MVRSRRRCCQRAALGGMQMMVQCAYEYSREYDMDRLVRQTFVSTIHGGTAGSSAASPRESWGCAQDWGGEVFQTLEATAVSLWGEGILTVR